MGRTAQLVRRIFGAAFGALVALVVWSAVTSLHIAHLRYSGSATSVVIPYSAMVVTTALGAVIGIILSRRTNDVTGT